MDKVIEVVGRDGVIYHVRVECPASGVDRQERESGISLSDVQQRFLKVLKEGTAREPRVVPR